MTSPVRGIPFSVVAPSAIKHAAIIGTAANQHPLIYTVPLSWSPPSIKKLSILFHFTAMRICRRTWLNKSFVSPCFNVPRSALADSDSQSCKTAAVGGA
jgi:hypothetical protein